MKLDAYVMHEAVRARDKEAILDLFQQHFAPISLYREQSWQLLSAAWLGVGAAHVAIRAYDLAYWWSPIYGFNQKELFAFDPPRLPVIHVHDALWKKQ